MFSKSIFGNSSCQSTKSILNPTIPFQNNEYKFTVEEFENLYDLQEYYTENLANKTYDNIPTNYLEFSDLFESISNIQIHTQNSNIQLLLKITLDGLVGAMNIFGLNMMNIELNLKNILLQNQINDILSSQNEYMSVQSTSNQYTIQKSFSLAPLYSYYISMFGLPEQGKGFNNEKIQIIKSFLETNGINPYR